MKKTIAIHIGGSAFTIDDDAYAALETYLNGIKSHFTDDEVITDIEARIAERFAQMTAGTRVVEMRDVTALIEIMGRVEDIVGEAGETPFVDSTSGVRRLFRDYDNRVIEGVAAGFAAYFGIDVSMMRIIFVLVTLLSGVWLGLLTYVVLAAILPKAETPAEKMQMRGGPVTLTSFEQTIRDKAADIESRHHVTTRVQMFFERVFAAVGTVFRAGVSFIGRMIGAVLTFFASIGLIAGTILFVNVLVNSDAEYIKFPLVEVVSRPLFYTFVSVGFILCAIPVGAALLFGIGLLRKRMIANAGMVFGILAGLWIIGVGGASVLWLKYGYVIEERMSALPQYRAVEKVVSVTGPLTAIVSDSGTYVVYETAPTSSIVIRGGADDVSRVSTTLNMGALSVDRTFSGKACMFCSARERLTVTVTSPTIAKLSARNGSRIVSDSVFTLPLGVAAIDGARIDLDEAQIAEVIVHAEHGAFVELGAAARAKLFATDGARIVYRSIGELLESRAERGAQIERY